MLNNTFFNLMTAIQIYSVMMFLAFFYYTLDHRDEAFSQHSPFLGMISFVVLNLLVTTGLLAQWLVDDIAPYPFNISFGIATAIAEIAYTVALGYRIYKDEKMEDAEENN